MIHYDEYEYTYTVTTESRWFSAAVHQGGVMVHRSRKDGGVAWEFRVTQLDLGGPTLKVAIFGGDAWEAFHDIPEFFEALRVTRPSTLDELRGMMDGLGFTDKTDRPDAPALLVDPKSDPHRRNPDVHWRLYLAGGEAQTICVQDFDYPDYDPAGFLTPEAYDSAEDAEVALRRLQVLARRVGG